MKKIFLILFFGSIPMLSQENNGLLFFGEYVQAATFLEDNGGTAYGGTLNLQKNTNLFTGRYMYHDVNDVETSGINLAQQPSVRTDTQWNLHEIALLYGKRYVKRGHSYSFSAGVSYNSLDIEIVNTISATATNQFSETRVSENDNYIGVPLEVNIKWFKKKKSPYRVLELFPVGEDTAVGNSIGVKLFGTISKSSVIGVGLTIGIGSHKYYE